jgi:hypothetical protein
MPKEKSVSSKPSGSVWGGSVEFLGGSGTSWAQGFYVDFVGVFLVFFLASIERLPAVNEPHYWTKAAHFWNPEFGRGDLFLESANAHWLFYATFGALTRILQIEQAVWTGRLVVWGLLALGWTFMMRRALVSQQGLPHSGVWVATLSAGVWCAAMRWWHLAGEWVIGGVESKAAAYALVFFAFGFFFSKRWTWGWVCIGVAAALHVVVGLWVFLGALVASFLIDHFSSEEPAGSLRGSSRAWWLKNGWGLPFAALGLGMGMLPPLLADLQTTSGISTQAAMIQVYKRLGHHLAPTAISWERWRLFGVVLLVAGAVLVGCLGYGAMSTRMLASKRKPRLLTISNWSAWPYGLRWFFVQALFGLLIGSLGCLVDWGSFSGLWSKEFSAKILKYYWFRWNDVAMCLWVAAGSVWLATRAVRSATAAKEPFGSMLVVGHRVSVPQVVLFLVVVFGAWGLWDRIATRGSDWLGEGERARLLSKSDGLEEQLGHYEDWLQVCQFIRERTDAQELWLTPRNQQTFKWHTGRGEVAAWKDMPQDSASVVEWFARLQECYPVDDQRSLLPWTTEKIMDLHKRYGFRYVLIDKRIDGQSPPLLPMLYPNPKVGQQNATFAVFEIPR